MRSRTVGTPGIARTRRPLLDAPGLAALVVCAVTVPAYWLAVLSAKADWGGRMYSETVPIGEALERVRAARVLNWSNVAALAPELSLGALGIAVAGAFAACRSPAARRVWLCVACYLPGIPFPPSILVAVLAPPLTGLELLFSGGMDRESWE